MNKPLMIWVAVGMEALILTVCGLVSRSVGMIVSLRGVEQALKCTGLACLIGYVATVIVVACTQPSEPGPSAKFALTCLWLGLLLSIGLFLATFTVRFVLPK